MQSEVRYLYLDDIIPNRFQPRENFDEQALKELAVSIKEHGVIQPIVVRQIGEKYEIIAGERRYKASTMAGLTKIPAIINNLDDKESSKVALIENLQRRDLTAIEEARTYQKILELDALTQEELAKTMGKSQSAVSNKLRLLTLTDEVQDALLHEQISERHARSLLNISDPQKQVELLNKIINMRMTVRELDQEIKNMNGESNSQTIDSVAQENPINNNPTMVDINKITSEAVDINEIQNQAAQTPIQQPGNMENAFIPTFTDENQPNNNEEIIGNGLLAGIPVESNINNQMPIIDSNINNQPAPINQPEPIMGNGLYSNAGESEIKPIVNEPIINTNNNLFGGLNTNPIVEQAPNNTETNANVQTAVNDIKTTVEKIKQNGKKVDIEEFDFDDFYQIVIRVDKQN